MRSKDDDGLNDYIEQLERYFLELKASNTLNLIMKLDEMNGTIVDDLDKVINSIYDIKQLSLYLITILYH